MELYSHDYVYVHVVAIPSVLITFFGDAAIYPHLGKTNTGRAIYNKEEKLCGSAKLQVSIR